LEFGKRENNVKKTLGLVGIAAVTLGSSFSAVPAFASTSDCGPTPTGGTLTEANGVCTLKFTTPGTYSFTTPTALSHLAAATIGGGGGLAYFGANGNWDFGYAGNAGSVDYADFTNSTKGKAFQIVIGQGGETALNSPSAGTASTVTSGIRTLTGAGGAAASTSSFCTVGTNGMVGVGDGAGGNSTSRAGETCVQGPGFNFTSAFPELFPTNDIVIGLGGMMYNSGSRPALAPGSGASGTLTTAEPSQWVSKDDKGADGAAIFRWKVPAGLANTGTDNTGSTSVAAGAIILGSALLVASTKRRRGVAKHRG
jgi:LPXTG-motif cell wall-anchored protein